MKILTAAVLCALAALGFAADAARAQGERYLQAPVGLPAGPGPGGLSTAVHFFGGCPRGQFSGIIIERMIPETQRIRIQEQWGTGPLGRILYDGGITAGQFIPFTHVRVVWTGWKGGYGNHMNGIVVRGVCLAGPGATTPGTPPPGAANDQFCRNLYGRADAENRAGNAARDRGDLAGARSHYQQALALFRQGGADPRCTRFRGDFANAAAIVERNFARVGQAAPTVGSRVFYNPMINGALVDHCVTWATNCDAPAATMYCQRMGLNRAIAWKVSHPGRTWIMGENRYCQGGFCGGFAQIVCQ